MTESEKSKEITFKTSVFLLCGHVLGSAALFIFIAGVAWGLGALVQWANKTHAFTPAILSTLHGVELFLFGFDVLLSGYVLLVGAARFIKEIWKGSHE